MQNVYMSFLSYMYAVAKELFVNSKQGYFYANASYLLLAVNVLVVANDKIYKLAINRSAFVVQRCSRCFSCVSVSVV